MYTYKLRRCRQFDSDQGVRGLLLLSNHTSNYLHPSKLNTYKLNLQTYADAANGYGVAMISRLLKLYVSFAKEPYKREDILQKRPIIYRSLQTVATP